MDKLKTKIQKERLSANNDFHSRLLDHMILLRKSHCSEPNESSRNPIEIIGVLDNTNPQTTQNPKCRSEGVHGFAISDIKRLDVEKLSETHCVLVSPGRANIDEEDRNNQYESSINHQSDEEDEPSPIRTAPEAQPRIPLSENTHDYKETNSQVPPIVKLKAFLNKESLRKTEESQRTQTHSMTYDPIKIRNLLDKKKVVNLYKNMSNRKASSYLESTNNEQIKMIFKQDLSHKSNKTDSKPNQTPNYPLYNDLKSIHHERIGSANADVRRPPPIFECKTF